MSKTLLTNANYLDVIRGDFVENHSILIEDGTIQSIAETITPDDGMKTYDLGGTFVLPGFIDCHVHVNAISANLNDLRFTPPSYVTPQAMRIMKEMLMRGFTTVRDAAGADWGIAKAVEEGYINGPRIIFGGQALSPSGGHGDSRSRSEHTTHNPQGTNLSILCDGVPAVRKAARDLIRTGAKHIKIMTSGGVASPTDRIDSLQFSKDEIRAIVEEADAANIYVLAHAYTARSINRALTLGVRSIEHGNLLDEDSLDLFLKHNAFLVPTLITYFALKEEGLELGLPQNSYDKINTVLENGRRSIEMAHKAGVKIAFGTDLLGDMHRRQLEQFELLEEIMDPLDVIRTATVTASKLLQMEDQIGVIKEGAMADLIVYSENPLERVQTLQDPQNSLKLVMKDGKIYKNQL